MAKQLIVRISPVTSSPVLFDALSRNNGRLKAIVNNEEVEVGLDYYAASEPMDEAQARRIVQAYAKHANIPEHDILVRQRLPKTSAKPRATNDANLVLVKGDDKKTSAPKQPAKAKKDDLQSAAQKLQDQHDAEKGKPEQKVSTPDNPEGAVVQPQAGEKRQKRSYNRKSSKKSEAAMKRYLSELSKNASESPTLFEPVASNVPQQVQDDAIMELAHAIAKILKSSPGAL